MSKVHLMISETAASGDVTSAEVHFQHTDDEVGLYQVTATAGGTGALTNVFFYGRLSKAHTWTLVASSGAVDSAAAIGGKMGTINIMPDMYVVADVGSSPTFKVSIQE